jgi:hypothetical protein
MKRVAILQSNYIPWKGYFDIIGSVDEFILYDDMQFTRRDWRNRNKIKTSNGLVWLTIPVEVKGKFDQRICDTKIDGLNWVNEHLRSLKHNYSKAKCFMEQKDFIFGLYKKIEKEKYLSKVNYLFLKELSEFFGISTKITWSMDYKAKGTKTERLVSLCKSADATIYLSGPAAKDYLIDQLFEEEGIKVEFIDYSGYIEYDQLFPPFEHGVSVVDLLFNCGKKSKLKLKFFGNGVS